MELGKYKKKLQDLLKKNKYALIVLLIGLVLMMIPSFSADTESKTASELEQTIPQVTAEEKLANILTQIHGAGKVSVMLMESAGEEIIYQTDSDITSSGSKNDTVTVTDADRNQTGLVRQVLAAQYAGAIIVCEGADDPQIHLAIVDAVSRVTGLGSNRISVLKMK